MKHRVIRLGRWYLLRDGMTGRWHICADCLHCVRLRALLRHPIATLQRGWS